MSEIRVCKEGRNSGYLLKDDMVNHPSHYTQGKFEKWIGEIPYSL